MKLSYVLIFILLIVGYTTVKANEGWYFEAGISIHNTKYATPEINLPNPLGNTGFGYTFRYKDDEYADLYFKHTTSIPFTEDGYGLNQIGLQYRKYFKW